jgi:hypothetical protein
MASTSYERALREARSLPREEQLLLIEELTNRMTHPERATSILELGGLGQEIWQQQDAQEYVNSERASWNG